MPPVDPIMDEIAMVAVGQYIDRPAFIGIVADGIAATNQGGTGIDHGDAASRIAEKGTAGHQSGATAITETRAQMLDAFSGRNQQSAFGGNRLRRIQSTDIAILEQHEARPRNSVKIELSTRGEVDDLVAARAREVVHRPLGGPGAAFATVAH